MLDKGRQYVERHLQAAAYSLSVLKQNSFSTLMTISVIAVALTLPSLFWILNSNIKSVTAYWHKNGHVSLYLNVNATPADMQQSHEAVLQLSGIDKAVLKTPEEAFQELQSESGIQDTLKDLPSNPLPAVIDIIPKSDVDTPLKLTQLMEKLKLIPHADQVRLDNTFLERLYAILTLVKGLVQGMMVILSCAVVLIIGNTLRLVFYHRQEELLVLKLIGARDAYIMRPFSYLGIWYGLLGALGALLLESLFLFHLNHAAAHFISVYQITFPFIGLTLQHAYLLLFFSGGLGYIAAFCFVRTRLASIETIAN